MGLLSRNVQGYRVSFLEADAQTPLPLKLRFRHPKKLRALAKACGATVDADEWARVEREIEKGRGGVFLSLSEDQYRKLTRA
jgi:hypothetical protein